MDGKKINYLILLEVDFKDEILLNNLQFPLLRIDYNSVKFTKVCLSTFGFVNTFQFL